MLSRHSMVIAACILASGCSSDKILLSAGPGQDSIVRNGLLALISQKKHVVMLRPNTRLVKGNKRPSFTVVVLNRGNQPLTLLESNVTAQQTIDGRPTAVHVYQYAELVKEEETRQTVVLVASIFGAAVRDMNAANAGNVHTTGSYNSYGSSGNTHGTYSAVTHDPLRAQIARQAAHEQSRAAQEEQRIQGEQNLSRLEQTIMKDNTVMVGEWVGGSIVLDQPDRTGKDTSDYSITVEFDGERHSFDISHVST